ncbi:permease-like cell division protein FtsX [Microbacterium sp. BG28]|uniref:permease-like cell division protein FtsX n=1 Tax=unclassified Microbacterium TaxID=2609290 RepID=UPI0028576797|nr:MULTISPECIES: permease-like cell division protein FtsX [unclassified Microbacterium]MDR6201271.1 cell division transport system permease protein [Microbacterium sp. SORGH_AS_0428]MDY0828910.1 permease-like cell division protein FtsX [Microbacterium sp. BG28]
MRFGLIMGEALSGLRRNASMVISVVLVTFVSLTFVGAAVLMQMQIGKMKDFWVDRAQVAVYMCTSVSTAGTCSDGVATQDEIDQVTAELNGPALSPLIKEFTFETNEQVYEKAIQQLGSEYENIVTPDQFNATFSINLVDQSQSDVIAEAFGGSKGVEEVKDQMQYLEPLFSALTIATYIAVGIAGLMLVAAVLLIATTIRLSAFARRKELGIMRLVGASNRFIQTPFILEGVFAALIGSALASVGVWATVEFGINGYLRERVGFVTTWVGYSDLALVIPVIVVIGVLLAALSAGFAIRRWLRA